MKRESKKGKPVSRARQRTQAISGTRSHNVQFAVCINNDGYPASLELGKLYRLIPDNEAQSHGLVRIIDESGEDYAYSSSRFQSMKVSPVIERALLQARR